MALFRRNQAKTTTLPELEQYYNAEKRERSGLKWLLTLVSLACIGLVFIGLFFGGKWLYKKVTDKNTDKPVAVQVQNNTGKKAPATTGQEKSDSGNKPADTEAKPSDKPAANTPATSTPVPGNTPAATPGTSAAPGAGQNQGTTPSAAASGQTLANTGPEDVFAYFLLAVICGTLLYRHKLKQSL